MFLLGSISFGTIGDSPYNGGVLHRQGLNREVPLYYYVFKPATCKKKENNIMSDHAHLHAVPCCQVSVHYIHPCEVFHSLGYLMAYIHQLLENCFNLRECTHMYGKLKLMMLSLLVHTYYLSSQKLREDQAYSCTVRASIKWQGEFPGTAPCCSAFKRSIDLTSDLTSACAYSMYMYHKCLFVYYESAL